MRSPYHHHIHHFLTVLSLHLSLAALAVGVVPGGEDAAEAGQQQRVPRPETHGHDGVAAGASAGNRGGDPPEDGVSVTDM